MTNIEKLASEYLATYGLSKVYSKTDLIRFGEVLMDSQSNLLAAKNLRIAELESENIKLTDALGDNVCGYCWRNMDEKHEPKGIELENKELRSQNTALLQNNQTATDCIMMFSKMKQRSEKAEQQLTAKTEAVEELVNGLSELLEHYRNNDYGEVYEQEAKQLLTKHAKG